MNFLRRTLIVAGGRSVVSLLELIVVVLLVRWLEPRTWTSLALVFTIYQTARSLGGLSIKDGIDFFYPRVERARRRTLVLQTMLMLLASGALAALVILGLDSWLTTVSPPVADLLPWVALAVVLVLPSTCSQQVLVAAERLGWASVYDAMMTAVNGVCLIGPLLLGWGVRGAVYGLVFQAMLRTLVFSALVLRAVPTGALHLELGFVWRQITFTAPLSLSLAGGVLNRYLDKWIVAGMVPLHFGAYAFAAQELPLLPLIGISMGAILTTRISHAFHSGQPERAASYWYAASARCALVVGPVTIGLISCAPEAITLLLKPVYANAVIPFQLYTTLLLVRIMPVGTFLRAAGRTDLLWWISFGLLALNAAVSPPLTWWLGISGTALGTLVATATIIVASLFAIARVSGVTLKKVFPWGRYGKVLAVAASSALTAATAASSLDALVAATAASPLAALALRLLLKAGLYVGLYLGLAWLLSLHRDLPQIPADDPEFLRALHGPKGSEAR